MQFYFEGNTKVQMTALICSALENLAMILGIIFIAVHFNRISILWFLLAPMFNAYHTRLTMPIEESVDSETDGDSTQAAVRVK